MSTKPKETKHKNKLKAILGFVLAFSIPFTAITVSNELLLKNYIVPSASMETTLMTNDRIFATVIHGQWEPQRGKIVIFKDTENWLEKNDTEYLVKRVIGLPGDTISCCTEDGKLLVNGEPYNEEYIIDGSNMAFEEQTVPEGYLFMLGDNREFSADSRYHINEGTQFIPISSVESTVAFRYWPLSSFGNIPNE